MFAFLCFDVIWLILAPPSALDQLGDTLEVVDLECVPLAAKLRSGGWGGVGTIMVACWLLLIFFFLGGVCWLVLLYLVVCRLLHSAVWLMIVGFVAIYFFTVFKPWCRGLVTSINNFLFI